MLLVKLVAPAALFAYLLWRVPAADYQAFLEQPKQWPLLFAAQLTALLAITISFLRWFLLVRSFEIPFTPGEALRLGFLGYLLNFVSFGSVGGDLFKAILVARDKPEKRPEAVASVLLDRAIGLLGLIILAWVSLLSVPSEELSSVLLAIRRASGIVVVASVVALVSAVFAGQWFERLLDTFQRLPLAGPTLVRMARAVRKLRSRPQVILLLLALAVTVHTLLAGTIYLISCGVYSQQPTLMQHMMVVPPGMAAGALPLAPGGIGLQEGALAELFRQLPDLPEKFSGMLVATVYRMVTVAICGIGLLLYWLSHGKDLRLVKKLSGANDSPSSQVEL
ncbi:MAG: lysylphosphatidylglycerol synthase transmembrane domain-containing protein [Aureliella sp.]